MLAPRIGSRKSTRPTAFFPIPISGRNTTSTADWGAGGNPAAHRGPVLDTRRRRFSGIFSRTGRPRTFFLKCRKSSSAWG